MKLSALATDTQMFCWLGLHKSITLAENFQLSLADDQQRSQALELTKLLAENLSPHCSGVVLDPELSFYALGQLGQTGLLLSLDKPTSERDPLSLPPLTQHWGIEHVRHNYGVAILELYYHPQEPEALRKKQLVAELYDYAQHEGISLVVTLLLYEYDPPPEVAQPFGFEEAQLLAAQEFRSLCDAVVLDYPQNALATATLTAELDIPWLVVAREESYDEFKEKLRISLEGGARGYLAGQFLWKDLDWWKANTLDLETAHQSITTTVRDRVIELSRIVEEAAWHE